MTAELQSERTRRMNAENKYDQLSSFPLQEERGLAELQLDLNRELDRIYHLLQGHLIERDDEGNEVWREPADDRLKIFSEYGVKQIMNIISFYISKKHILSYYTDEKVISQKVYDFGIELSDLVFNKYESFFYYPSPEELYEKYLPIMRRNNFNLDEKELYWKCVQWSEQELKNKIAHFPMLCLSLIDAVHATLLRGLRGETMKSFRTMAHIHQNIQSNPQQLTQQKPFSALRPSTWGK